MKKNESYHLEVLRQWIKNHDSVPHHEVREAVIYFRNKKRPDFIPESTWETMLSWG